MRLDRRALEEYEGISQALDNHARIFLYSGEVEAMVGRLVGVRIDGRAIGRIGSNQYACLSVDVGKHMIRVGHTDMEIEASGGAEDFIGSRRRCGTSLLLYARRTVSNSDLKHSHLQVSESNWRTMLAIERSTSCLR